MGLWAQMSNGGVASIGDEGELLFSSLTNSLNLIFSLKFPLTQRELIKISMCS